MIINNNKTVKNRKKTYIILGITFVIIIVGVFTFFSIGNFLSPQSNLEKADVIIAISGGDTRARTDEAIKLYKDGWAPYLIFSGAARSGDVSNAESMKNLAIKKGISADKIFIEENSTSTYENALLSKPIIEKNKWKKIIIVTSPYHQRRAFMNFSFVLGKDVKILNHSCDDNYWSVSAWYKGDKNRATSLEELSRIIYLVFTKNYSKEVK